MDKILKKAIEGGYKYHNWGEITKDISNSSRWLAFNSDRKTSHPVNEHDFILDPLFWQALSKSCGWIIRNFEHDTEDYEEEWKMFALRFHEINLTQGFDSAVAYLQELISK